MLMSMEPRTAALGKAGLGEGTNAATLVQAAPNGAGLDYVIDGVAYHKADGDNIAMTALPVQAVSTKCLYLIQINAAGTISVKKGVEVTTADLTAEAGNLQWPQPDDDNCPIGGFKIETDASITFTSGTTDLGASGITDTFYDFALGIPAVPQT